MRWRFGRFSNWFSFFEVMLFSSPELKARELFWSLVVRRLSVRPSVCLFVYFYIFISFFRPTEPISTKLGTKHPWKKGMKFVQTKGPPFSKGRYKLRNSENTLKNFKNIFISRTTWPTKLGTKHSWVNGIQLCSNVSKARYKRNSENTLMKIKNLFLQNHWANFNQTKHNTLLGKGDSILFKGRGPPFSKGR